MDLALNNQQRLMCHKTQINNQPTNLDFFKTIRSIISYFQCKESPVRFHYSYILLNGSGGFVCKLFVLDWNTRYCINEGKLFS